MCNYDKVANLYSCMWLPFVDWHCCKNTPNADILDNLMPWILSPPAVLIQSSNVVFSVKNLYQHRTQRRPKWAEQENHGCHVACITLCNVEDAHTGSSHSVRTYGSLTDVTAEVQTRLYLCFMSPVFLVVMWPLSLLPFLISLWSSVPAPRAFKNLKYSIFPCDSNQFQTPPFPDPPPLSFSPSLRGYRPKPRTHTHIEKWSEKDRVSKRHRVLLAFP